jgi:hypothetical protein
MWSQTCTNPVVLLPESSPGYGLRDLGWQNTRSLKRDPSKNINKVCIILQVQRRTEDDGIRTLEHLRRLLECPCSSVLPMAFAPRAICRMSFCSRRNTRMILPSNRSVS